MAHPSFTCIQNGTEVVSCGQLRNKKVNWNLIVSRENNNYWEKKTLNNEITKHEWESDIKKQNTWVYIYNLNTIMF